MGMIVGLPLFSDFTVPRLRMCALDVCFVCALKKIGASAPKSQGAQQYEGNAQTGECEG